VTSKRKKWLEEVWPALLQNGPSGDLDSDLRVFLIAVRVGKNRAGAEAFLQNAIANRQKTLAELEGKMKEEGSGVWLADQYVSLRARASAAILKAEAKAIDSILDGLRGGLPIAKRARAR
jgi:hypothetical protein